MEKRYLVKEISTATKENHNFFGKVITSYYGISDILVATDDEYDDLPLVSSRVAVYGYKRKCDAVRNWTYKNPENTKYWESTAEIVEYTLE